MFTFLHPPALLALLGLLVPVAIHLWNRRPGREVAVGSIRWLAAGANRRLRNLKLEQLWLLLLRAALLAVLAGAIAGPVWRQPIPASRGVVLLSPEAAGSPALAALRPTIDSLRRRGYALRWLARDFPRVIGTKWRTQTTGQATNSPDSTGSMAPPPNDTWSRVQQATGVFPGQPLFVVTSARLRNFQGVHQPLPATVTWQAVPAPTYQNWLQAAALRGDSLRLLLGQSTEAQTTFRLGAVARPKSGAVLRVAGLSPLRFENQAGSSLLRPLPAATDSETTVTREVLRPIPVRTKPMRAIIYSTSAFATDARVLQAALRAAAMGLIVPLALTSAAQLPRPTDAPDWLFWLSDAPLPTAWREAARKGTHIWLEARGPGVADTARRVAVGAEAAGPAVFRRAAPPTSAQGAVLWADGQGRPVLTRQALGQGAIFQLHTRLSPVWSELADDAELPALLLPLLQPELPDDFPLVKTSQDKASALHDQRALDPTQLILRKAEAAAKAAAQSPKTLAPAAFRYTDLRPWLVLAAGLLFAFERLLAHRREARALSAVTI